MMDMQSCCFADQTYCFFDVLVAIPAIIAKAPYYQIIRTSGDSQIFLFNPTAPSTTSREVLLVNTNYITCGSAACDLTTATVLVCPVNV